MGRRGFTLLEVMIVVAIIGIVSALVGNATQATQRRARMHDAARQFRARVEKARTLSMAAGPSLGNSFANCSTGSAPIGNIPPQSTTLTVAIDPAANAYQVPTTVRFDPADPLRMQSDCQTYQVADAGESRGTAVVTVNGGTALTFLAFTPTGRLDETINAGPVFVRFEDSQGGEATRGYGIRILPSGIICSASGAAATDGCSEDP